MSDKPRRKPSAVELISKQSEILRMRFKTLAGEWREEFVHHTRASSDDDPVCVFCGTTEGEVRQVFDGKRTITVCAGCLAESSGDDDHD